MAIAANARTVDARAYSPPHFFDFSWALASASLAVLATPSNVLPSLVIVVLKWSPSPNVRSRRYESFSVFDLVSAMAISLRELRIPPASFRAMGVVLN
jgi:hypothetical protein